LLLNGAMRDRSKDLWMQTRVTGELLGIDLIALALTVRYGSQFADVGHDHLMAELLQLFADPDRMDASLHRYACWRQILEPLLDRLRCGSEAASINDFAVLVQSAVMAPDFAKVDTNRQLGPGMPAWNFRDEVMR
jgi:hypothetical protein